MNKSTWFVKKETVFQEKKAPAYKGGEMKTGA
jgi:hypothetical protein